MKTEDFDFALKEELIAQYPSKKRDGCRLMVLDRFSGNIEHNFFYNILDYLKEGDCLVLNDSKVLPARLFGHREGKEESIEVLLLQKKEEKIWSSLVRPGKKMKINSKIIFSDELQARVVDILDDGQRLIQLDYQGVFEEILDRIGQMPTPPYITEKLKNKEDYQTVYAKYLGSAAAPTAGLHFSTDLLKKIREKGVSIAFLTLHVGLGTFRPVMEDQVEDHQMHEEFYLLPKESADLINETKKKGGRIISVGTTSTRTLESVYRKKGEITEDSGFTDIFIYPGYTYQVIDGIITNFHLPKSSLIMMISAFCGRENILHAYKIANDMEYRFFSFGDAMLIVDRSKDD